MRLVRITQCPRPVERPVTFLVSMLASRLERCRPRMPSPKWEMSGYSCMLMNRTKKRT